MNPVSFTTKYVDEWKKHTTLHPGVKENSTYKPSFLKGNRPSLQGFTQDKVLQRSAYKDSRQELQRIKDKHCRVSAKKSLQRTAYKNSTSN
jgi:hypothetical protein